MSKTAQDVAGENNEMTYQDVFHAMRNSPLILPLSIYAAVASILTGFLLGYHISLLTSRETTYD